MSKSFYEQRQQQKKAHQEQQERHQQEQQRTAWEMICLKLEQRVERLNKGAFALVERQVRYRRSGAGLTGNISLYASVSE